MKYVTIIGAGGKVLAVGKLVKYYGKWICVRRNDNEMISVNTDFVQAIHFLEMPTQKMLESMSRSVPVVESGQEAQETTAPIAVKQTSGRVDQAGLEDMIQSIVDTGPPGMEPGSAGVGLFALPRTAPLPDGVTLEEEEESKRAKRKTRARKVNADK